MSALAEQLKRERRNKGLSQAELAARMGTQQSAISTWETGAKEPSLASLERWIEALGLALTLTPARAVRSTR